MSVQFVHTFVFSCASCQLPVSITRVSGDQSKQSVGDGAMRTSCGYCGKPCYGSSVTARYHYVEEWRRALEAGHH